MVLLKFADNSSYNIPLEELQKLPFFKKLPTLKDDNEELDLSFNKDFTYNNLIKCIAFSEEINNSSKRLIDFVGIDLNYFHSINKIKNLDLNKAIKDNDYENIIVKCKLEDNYLANNYSIIRKLPLKVFKKCITIENNKTNVLIKSVKNNDKEITELLIEIGANVNGGDCQNITPLIWAVIKNNKEIVKILVKAGANLFDKDNNNKTAISVACSMGCKEMVELVVKKGCNNVCEGILTASVYGNKDIIEFLINFNMNMTITCNHYNEALIKALSSYSENDNTKEIIKLLINNGANVNYTGYFGYTPLILASKRDYKDIVKLLIQAGANINYHTNNNYTALAWASINKNKEIKKILKNAGAKQSWINKIFGY